MNQILSVEMPNQRKNSSKKVNIKSIIIFFCIILLIFGILLIGIGVFSKIQNSNYNNSQALIGSSPNSEQVEDKNKPKIEIVPGASTLNITVSSESIIDNLTYKWNNEEATQVNANGEKEVSIEINIPIGTNILSITAKDENGVEQTFTNEYVGVEVYKPTITLGQENNTIKIICDSESMIESISYHFDNEEEQTQQVNSNLAEILIDAIEGEHTLTIVVVNQNGEKYEDTRPIYIPKTTIVTDGQKFIVTVSDTREIQKVSVNMNGEEQEIMVNDTKYEGTFELQDGENRIIVVAYNSDGISITKRVRYEK